MEGWLLTRAYLCAANATHQEQHTYLEASNARTRLWSKCVQECRALRLNIYLGALERMQRSTKLEQSQTNISASTACCSMQPPERSLLCKAQTSMMPHLPHLPHHPPHLTPSTLIRRPLHAHVSAAAVQAAADTQSCRHCAVWTNSYCHPAT
jgi:hypothetical protein